MYVHPPESVRGFTFRRRRTLRIRVACNGRRMGVTDMLKRVVRHAIVGVTLATVAGIATASSLGYVGQPTPGHEIVYLETIPVLYGDLGEVVIISKRRAE
jgi:hypothetical protein